MKHFTRDEDFCRECGAPPGVSCATWADLNEDERATKALGFACARCGKPDPSGDYYGGLCTACDDADPQPEGSEDLPPVRSRRFGAMPWAALAVVAFLFGGGLRPLIDRALFAPAKPPVCSYGFVWTGSAYKLKPNGEIESPDPRGIWTDDRTELVFDLPNRVAFTCAKVSR